MWHMYTNVIFQSKQGVCPPEEPGRGSQHIHRKPRPRGEIRISLQSRYTTKK